MSTASPAPAPSSAAGAETPSGGLGRAIDLTSRIATSWVGLITAYVGAISAAIVAFQQLQKHLSDWPLWTRILLVSALPVAVLIFHTIPTLIEQHRKRRLTQITGNLRSGYFRLIPREDQATFTRADGKHEEVLEWLEKARSPLLYLTGQSGSGKSSLMAAWVIPHLLQEDVRVLCLRGYEDPLAALARELQKPGVIWQKPAADTGDLASLLERACRYIRPKRLLLVFDQFEEFVILQDSERQKRFEGFLAALRQNPIEGLFLLFVFRSDYIGLVEKLSLPPLAQNTNWKEVPPFTENAAREFMQDSGLKFDDKLMRDVLREAAEIEQTKGIVRPVTINLCGLVLGRFANGVPRNFRGGGLIRAFLRESILLPSVRDVAPRLLPHLISSYVTKRPRTISDLAKNTGFDSTAVRGCMRVLGQEDRAIVRPLDEGQQTWEISHDFLVPMLDSILARWTASLWRKTRPWLPWIGAVVMVLVAVGASNWRKDPIAELTDLGWVVQKTDSGLSLTYTDGVPPKQSLTPLRALHRTLTIKIVSIDETISEWRTLPNLAELDITSSSARNVTNLEPLRGLGSLSILNLNGTNVIDLQPLRGLSNLSVLNLSRTRVKDLEPVKDLTNLSTLDLSQTAVTQLTPLRGLSKLSRLDVEYTNVANLEPLQGLTNLTSLYLGHSAVTDLKPLTKLVNLTSLELDNTGIDDLEPLKGMVKLTSLNLDTTAVQDLSPLKSLTHLLRLNLRSAPVTDLSPLEKLTSLTFLELDGVPVFNLEPLRGLNQLSVLSIDAEDIEELNGVPLLPTPRQPAKLKKEMDVSPLGRLLNLSSLSLEGRRIVNLAALKSLPKLAVLSLARTEVSAVEVRDLHQSNPRLQIFQE